MKPWCGVMLLFLLPACRDYDLQPHLADDDGLIPAEQYAAYGREQAQEVAIAREYARAHEGSSPRQLIRQAEAAMKYARALPDVVDVKADPLGLVLTIEFKSGWRTMVTPLDDGKGGAETPGLPAKRDADTSR